MAVNDRHRAMLEKVADDEAWSLDLSADWKSRLAADPRSTLTNLRQLYGKTSAKTSAVEDLYWRALLRHAHSEEELAEAILGRLDTASAEHEGLLDLEPQERDLLFEHLQKLAEQLLESVDADPEERQQAVAEPAALGEVALEEQGRRLEAAAFYALAHDRVSGQTPVSRFRRLRLCFLLCRVRVPPEERREHKIQPFVALAQRSVKAVDYTLRDAKVPDAVRQALRFRFHYWLGERLMALAQHQAAAEAFQHASLNAMHDDDKVESALRLALALQALDRLQEAYSHVLEVSEEVHRVEDPSLRQWWSLTYKDLGDRLGGGVNLPDLFILDEGGFFKTREAHERMLTGEINADELAGFFEENLRHILYKTPQPRPSRRHKIMLQLALVVLAQGRSSEADVLLHQAEELEEQFDDEKPKFRRQLLLARRYANTGNAARAAEIYAELLPHARQEPEDLPGFLGFYLEALIAVQDPPRAEQLADSFLVALERLLRRQPNAGARRYIRRGHQRAFEAAVLALTQTATRAGTDSHVGQNCLAKAWTVLDAARNLELHWQSQEPTDAKHMARLRQLEAAFHGQLRRTLTGTARRSDWEKTLDKVLEYEGSMSRDPKLPGFDPQDPPSDGVSMAFFELSDLFREPELVVLVYYKKTYHLGGGQDLQPRLARWRNHCFAAALRQTGTSRDLGGKTRRKLASEEGGDAGPPTIADLLPEDLPQLARRFLENDLETPRSTVTPEPLESGAWHVFPSGVLHSLLFEMLPEPGPRSGHFGSRRAVQLCLRSTQTALAPVKFAAGWLGLGGVPGVEGIPELEGALKEIDTIACWLRQQDFGNVESLTGSEAHGSALEARLTAEPPAVVHLATHGFKDEDHPDACTLVLAPAPGRPEGDLLPFRRIRQLPADGVELVILSACSSLIGRSDHCAGMEGLAWAFLQAGAKQVIASRYPVDDTETLRFMMTLYENLLVLPAAEALGRTRDECLRLKMDWLQVGAWSLWS